MDALFDETDARRALELENNLPEGTLSFGVPCQNRAAWEGVKQPIKDAVLKLAQNLSEQPDVIITEEIAHRFSTNGDRRVSDECSHRACLRLRIFAIAACLENGGRFLTAYESAARALLNFRTWVGTAHDGQLANYEHRTVTIDIFSASIAWELATADWLLGDLAGGELRLSIRKNLEWRIFEPFEAMLLGKKTAAHWFFNPTNWNAVCLGGVLGAALAVLESKTRRARYLAAWEKWIASFRKGYQEDGYCTEGLSYWVYGFSHYVYASELVRIATNGAVDGLRDPKMQRVAQFYRRIALPGGTYPCIGDCNFGYQPDSALTDFLEILFGEETEISHLDVQRLYDTLFFWFTPPANALPFSELAADEQFAFRTWFAQSGILVCRPGIADSAALSACLKGGNNREHHNHNDVGSFTVSKSGVQLISDVGHDFYTASTFSQQRYENPLLDSYGHSVPRPAGLLQKPFVKDDYTDAPYAAVIRSCTFSAQTDAYTLDLTPVYLDEKLLTLERSFVYRRAKGGSLEIEDCAQFSEPDFFETALLTYGTCQLNGSSVTITRGGQALRILFTASAPPEIRVEELSAENLEYVPEEFGGAPPHISRICVRLPSAMRHQLKTVLV